eukprot:2900580-Prymnesium_polylepis.1
MFCVCDLSTLAATYPGGPRGSQAWNGLLAVYDSDQPEYKIRHDPARPAPEVAESANGAERPSRIYQHRLCSPLLTGPSLTLLCAMRGPLFNPIRPGAQPCCKRADLMRG